jgi:hypothetical protein
MFIEKMNVFVYKIWEAGTSLGTLRRSGQLPDFRYMGIIYGNLRRHEEVALLEDVSSICSS